MNELPLAPLAGPPKERADAARNRLRILSAAAELVQAHGIDKVSMCDVASAAGVGTGTLYRRFGDRAGLAHALLDEQTREFQDELIAGPPPLGPGVSAAERLAAFGEGYLDLLERHAELILAAVSSGTDARGPHEFYATHIAILLREATPQLDADYTAQALLAMLSPAHHLRTRRAYGWSLERVRKGWREIVTALCAPRAFPGA